MKKMFRHIVMVAVAMLALSSLTSCNYNSLVEKRENADQQWAQVENVYQRRADLIPNLVNTVKGYASHESETLQAVVEARAKATSINIDPKNLDEASLKKFQDAQGELSAALGKSFSAPTVTDALVLATGAALTPSVPELVFRARRCGASV